MAMHVSEDDPAALRRGVSILCLIGAHLLFGLVLWAIGRPGSHATGPTLSLTLFVGLAFAQGSLLGVWGSLGAGPWWLRLAGLGIGGSGLAIGACAGLAELDWETFFIFIFATVLVAAVLTVFRCFGFRIGLPTTGGIARTELQFGIRHLLILTVVVAVVLAIGRNLKISYSDIDDVPFLAVIASAYALIGILSPWALLGGNLVVVRGVFLLAIAAAVGWGVGQVIPFTLSFWIGIGLTEAVLLIASLLVLRFCGYRLMRRCPVPEEQRPSKIA